MGNCTDIDPSVLVVKWMAQTIVPVCLFYDTDLKWTCQIAANTCRDNYFLGKKQLKLSMEFMKASFRRYNTISPQANSFTV